MTGQHGRLQVFLRNSREIEQVKQRGQRVSTAYFNLLVCSGRPGSSRMAVIVGRRFGLAVRRNRAKRVFRALGRAVGQSLNPGYDFLVFPKREALSLPHDRLEKVWNDALRRQGIAG